MWGFLGLLIITPHEHKNGSTENEENVTRFASGHTTYSIPTTVITSGSIPKQRLKLSHTMQWESNSKKKKTQMEEEKKRKKPVYKTKRFFGLLLLCASQWTRFS